MNLKNIKTEPENFAKKTYKPKIKDEDEKVEKKRNRPEEPDDDKKAKKIKIEVKTKIETTWEDYELLSETQNIGENEAKAIIKLFEDGNTIPFIARYRKGVTGNMSPERLREVKEEYDNITLLKTKLESTLKKIEQQGIKDQCLRKSILCARSIEELEHLYAPYKPGVKRSLAERAKALGLEQAALNLMNGSQNVDPNVYVTENVKELSSLNDVEKGLMHIIASVIATNSEVLSLVRKQRLNMYFIIESKKMIRKGEVNKKIDTQQDENKFSTYFNFKISTHMIKPHQVLAINRGESLKILSVKIVVPDFLFHMFKQFCTSKWMVKGKYDEVRKRILDMSIQDSYTRLVQPYVIREVRAELKSKAEKASYEVFSTNLKQLLLMPPLKGTSILGIDPGFTNGCKLAIISETGILLESAVIYPFSKKKDIAEVILKNMLEKHKCNLIALGNGTACRETETWLSELLQNNVFAPLNVKYTIVNECGASIYSCSSEAKKEFPVLDPNIISAVSLARRVQEPLAEFVKVEPKHLGVGMYQHDLPKKQLNQALEEVVSECVSFVGVDLNTASQCLLKQIAGLSEKRAANIIDHRTKNGIFTCRSQLLDVKGIGSNTFKQCAGFLRVTPPNLDQINEFYRYGKTDRFDCTYIHPESYDLANIILEKLKLDKNDIGLQHFIDSVKQQRPLLNLEKLSSTFQASTETITLILDSLSKPLNFDLRSECLRTPLFKKGLTSIYDLKEGSILTGSVNNITHFGCFIDIGIGQSGLIHQSKLGGFRLQIGDRVEVRVITIEIERKRVGLQMVNKL